MKKNPEKSLQEIAAWLCEESEAPSFKKAITDLLFELCELRSIPSENITETAREEDAVYERLIKSIKKDGLPGRIEKVAINETIAKDPRYTRPYYTTDKKPYKNRNNLIHIYEPENNSGMGHSLALNAHIDTVAPFFKPFIIDGVLYGRGACDDKGCCVAIFGASMLLKKLKDEFGISPRGRLVSMFVTEEESGGNGSLSLAADSNLSKLYDSIVVAESTQGQIHTANRGAVWYKVEIGEERPDTTAFALKIVRTLEKTGRALRAESDHPLFPDKPVQTCQGVLGAYGEHPSRICGQIDFSVSGEELLIPGITELVERGLGKYIAEYGDRTKQLDSRTNKPKLEQHYRLMQTQGELCLSVYGNTGHMGSSLEYDNAITKAAYIVPELLASSLKLNIELAKKADASFALEGGQGFLPCHSIEQVKSKMNAALSALYKEEHEKNGYRYSAPLLTFDKLHNDAFERATDSEEALKAVEAARLVGIDVTLPLIGFPVSCDARLFAGSELEKQVLTIGPGSIKFAHADNEQIDIAELAQSCAFYAIYALSYTSGQFWQN